MRCAVDPLVGSPVSCPRNPRSICASVPCMAGLGFAPYEVEAYVEEGQERVERALTISMSQAVCVEGTSRTAPGIDVRLDVRRGPPDPRIGPHARSAIVMSQTRSTEATKFRESMNATARPSATTTFSTHRSLWHTRGPRLNSPGVRPVAPYAARRRTEVGHRLVIAALRSATIPTARRCASRAGKGRYGHRAGLETPGISRCPCLERPSTRGAPAKPAWSRWARRRWTASVQGVQPGAEPCPRPAPHDPPLVT